MKMLFISCLLPFVIAVACFGQGEPTARPKQRMNKPGKAAVEGYVALDGKPLRGATIVLGSMTTHIQNGDWWFPIITPKFVGVIGETGTPTHEVPDWYRDTKTDKSGHFRAGLPEGMKILVFITAGPFFGHGSAWLEKVHNAPCGDSGLITTPAHASAVQNVRYNLDSGHTLAKGGCVRLLDNK